jgi:diguanylate cyclase (GGDEF)-like protein
MHLTGPGQISGRNAPSSRWLSPGLWRILVIPALLLVFELDRRTGSAPVQHLYYLPIILAALSFRTAGGLAASLASIVFYHLANPHLFTARYEESDIVQMTLFVVVGLVTARLKRDADRLHALAMTDDLTGLHNLRSFEARLADLLRRSRAASEPLSLLVLDVDHLKTLNDAHGHLTGAEAVRTVGQVLARRLPPGAIASRYGGDEFVVALPAAAEPEARAIADDLRRAVIAEAPILAGQSFPAATLTISIGLACVGPGDGPGAGDNLDAAGVALFRAADRGLYRAKAEGRNRICVFVPMNVIGPARSEIR